MKDYNMYSKFFISPDATIETALSRLEEVKGLGLVVVDENQNLIGSLTDGDIRRALAGGRKLTENIIDISHRNPVSVQQGASESELKKLTADKRIKVIPILMNTKVVDVYSVDDEETRSISVVIMAGGLGTRLGEHTKDLPKPMVDVCGKPVLERIINNFTKVGFKKFYISVNYKAHVIEDYFKDGSEFGCEITYLRENKRLGTAGSLSLLPEDVQGPVVVTNGDLLTVIDFRRLISFHYEHKSPITLCTRKYELQIPFGVVNIEDGQASSIDEKPTQSFNVSAGVYVINAELFKHIPKDVYFDMPTFLQVLMKHNIKADCFPMIEQWIDIGRISDLDYARSIYGDQK